MDRTIMASRPSIRIARKARSKAESDFATWLMMAKLGSFDDLPPNAQGFLTNYRARLERMSEAESKVVAVREVYAAYYSEMGGAGAAPEPEAPSPSVDDSVVRFQRPRKPQPAPPAGRFRQASHPKIRAGPADFRSHGGSDRRLHVSGALSR
jgi:hypothetical protein